MIEHTVLAHQTESSLSLFWQLQGRAWMQEPVSFVPYSVSTQPPGRYSA